MLKIVPMCYRLHRKDLEFPFTLVLDHYSMRSSLSMRRTGLIVPSLLHMHMLPREGMSEALT